MPRIPMGNDPGVGLGEARYNQVATTPDMGRLGRPVPKEVGPKLEVNKLDVVENKAAPLSQFKPVLPGNEGDILQSGIDKLSRRAEQFAAIQQEELKRVNDAKEKTGLLVSMGDQKASYSKNTLDIINNPEMPLDEKTKALQKLEDDFRGTIQNVKPELQPVVASEVMGTIGTVKAHARDVFLKNQQDGIKADLETRANQLTLDAASTGDLDGSLAHFDALRGAYKSAGLTDAHFTQDRLKFEQGVLQNDIMGNLKSTDSKGGSDALISVNRLLDRLNETDDQNVPTNWTRLSPATRNADISAVIQKKNQIESDMMAGANKELAQLKSNFSVGMAYYTDSLKNGDPVPPNLTVQLHQQAQAMLQLDPDKAAGYMGLLQLQKTEQQYGPGYRNIEAAKDPLFGTGVRPISFADMLNPDTFASKIAENIKMGLSVKQNKALTYVPILRNADMEGVAKTIEANPDTGIKLIDGLKIQLKEDGPKSLEFLAGQMANSKDHAAPAVAAIIYSVAKGDMNTAQVVANGMEVMKSKAIIMPKEADLRNNFQRLLGDALSENSPEQGMNFKQFETAYASLAARKNIVDGNLDLGTANEAFKRVVGSVTSFNGSSVLIPYGWTEGKLLNYKQSLTPETVQAMGGIKNMTNEKAVDFIRYDARWKAVGDGVYLLEYAGQIARDKKGDKFYFDVTTPVLNPKQFPEIEPLMQRMSQINQDTTLIGK